ncbi:Na+/H+ antiporter NhaC family protein [Desulfovibrio cuneatus]|uniref:Na+/H+ antiporter NhaC family protein n=1 Tax=Desulfovibrio cuneatus TaxID=159728 RepID=UPI000400DB95|nr:Na+/H+ antiporter NhaC family protein [Desulfovibrio cuneatus]
MDNDLKMRGGFWGGLVPLVIMVGGLIWLSVAERGGTKSFWAAAWIAIAVGIFFAKNPKDYCESIMRGIGDKTGIVIVTAWLFAGVFGKLMTAGGLVNGLLWMGMTTGAQGAIFVLLVFLAAMLFSLGTGSSTGTCIALAPVLYPAGYFLGADPAMLALAILSGAAFGDNLAPVSDTTIVSAFTQGATMQDVVRSRFPLCMTAAAFTAVVFLLFGSSGEVTKLPEIHANLNSSGLLMLLALVVVVVSSLAGRHIIESLIYGNITAAAVGIVSGNLKLTALFSIPAKRGDSTGLIEDGVNSVVGAIIFAILILAVTQVLVESGIMRRILALAESAIVKTVRQAESFIVLVTILISIPISANAPAELLVGPSLVRPVGVKFDLAPARRANLMDCAVCTIFFTLPWHIVVAAWYTAIIAASEVYQISAPSITVAFYNPYSWALLLVLFFSIATGWNRKFGGNEQEHVAK